MWTFVSKVMPLLFNMLSKFVIAFLPRNNRLLISWMQSPSAEILGPRRRNLSLLPPFPSICHEMMELDATILVCCCCFFLILSFKPAFSFSSCTLIKRFFSSSLLSVIKVVSCAFLRLLIFLPTILIPADDSSSQHFTWCHRGDNKQPCHTPFSILNQSLVPYKRSLTVAFWPAYRFLRR